MSIGKKMKSRVLKIVIIVIGLSLIFNLSRDILRLIKASDQIRQAEQKVRDLEVEQRQLVEKKEYFQSEEFVEEEARNKLNMAKPGETIVILPPSSGVAGDKNKGEQAKIPNWKKWWQLFF